MFINSYKLHKHELSCAKSCKLCASKKVQKSVPMLWKRPRNQPNMLNFVCPSCPRCGKCRNFQWFYPLQSDCRPLYKLPQCLELDHKDVMPCTSHQHTSLCISNGWKSPSVSKSPTVNVMKWYQVCTCTAHVMYYSTTYVLSTELGSLGLKSHALADSWPSEPSATVSPWMWKGLKVRWHTEIWEKTGKYSKPNRSTLGNK